MKKSRKFYIATDFDLRTVMYYCLNSSGFKEKRYYAHFLERQNAKGITFANSMTWLHPYISPVSYYPCNTYVLCQNAANKTFWKMGRRMVAPVHTGNAFYRGMCYLLKQFMLPKTSCKFHIQSYLNQQSCYVTKFNELMLLKDEKHTTRLD